MEIKENSKRKQNNYKSFKAERRKETRRLEAEERAAKGKKSAILGTKEKVKAGIITPCEGLVVSHKNTATYRWLESKKKLSGCK